MVIANIAVRGGHVALSHENTRLYKFRDRPQLNHLYYHVEGKEFYIFDHPALFDLFERRGVVVIDNVPLQSDEDAFVRYATEGLEDEIREL